MKQNANPSALIDAIEEQVEAELIQAQTDLDLAFQTEMKQYRDTVDEEIKLYIQQELTELRLSLIQNESSSKWKLKQDLLETRHRLVHDLFQQVELDLLAFSRSEQYAPYMIKKLTALQETVHFVGTIVVRPQDETLVLSWIKEQQLPLQIQIDTSNVLGGFLFVSETKRFEYDHTLVSTLAEQKQWFYEHSNLVL